MRYHPRRKETAERRIGVKRLIMFQTAKHAEIAKILSSFLSALRLRSGNEHAVTPLSARFKVKRLVKKITGRGIRLRPSLTRKKSRKQHCQRFRGLMSNQTRVSLYPSFIQTITVGPGVTPDHALLRSRAVPPIGNSLVSDLLTCTVPRSRSSAAWRGVRDPGRTGASVANHRSVTLPRRLIFSCFDYNSLHNRRDDIMPEGYPTGECQVF